MCKYHIGSTITYRPIGGGLRQVLVSTKENDIKNGVAGFMGYLVNDNNTVTDRIVWGYDRQITGAAS